MRNPFVQIALWTLGISAVGTVVVLSVPWLPEQASTQADTIDTFYTILSVISVVVFALVLSAMLVAVAHFRRRHNDPSDGEPIHGNSRLEVVWTAIPAVLMVAAGVAAAVVLNDIEEPKASTQTVNVTGQQFAWVFDYREQGFKSGTLHLVEDTPYLFKMNTKDVLHSFWVPEFRLKRDAVPGITTQVRVTPNRAGRYALVCAELCGLGHSTMRAPVTVESRAAFERWAAVQKRRQSQVGGAS
jgi:cytochrome c oxidase subunit 2